MRRHLMSLPLIAATALALSAAPEADAQSQSAGNTILVMDASGSMWGQIDGTNKIVIAREVIGTLLKDFPTDQNLGLTVYGHRTRGDCTDIETLVSPGPNTLDAIGAAVQSINPRGKTPMTDAIITAAKALRYTEEKATVILVSDGIETCNPDPCAAALALEEAGVDFTAHVVGFDVTDPEALAQMQCLAEGTGGQFLRASDANELSTALTRVAVAPEPDPAPMPEPQPEPEPQTITFEARIGTQDGPLITDPVFWDITGAELPDTPSNPVEASFVTGSYEAEAYWTAQEATASRQFIVQDAARTIVVVFEKPALTATITAPQTAVAGAMVEISWTGPSQEDDYIGIGRAGATRSARWDQYVEVSEGSPAMLRMPATPGPHVIQYFLRAGREPIGQTTIDVRPVEVSLVAPPNAEAGATVEIGWSGPNYPDDYIGIGPAGAERSDAWENFAYTRDGTPAQLMMPIGEGPYEITYFMAQDRTPVAAVPITLTPAQVSVSGPASAALGSTIQVAWTGPNNRDDYIGIGAVGATGGARWENFAYTRDGSPAQLLVPAEPGLYDITYFAAQDRTPLASTQITVEDVAVSVTAPAQAVAGATIEVAWTGPNAKDDYIGIGRMNATGGQRWKNYAFTRDGSPVSLQVPAEPGDYVIQYFLGQDRTPLAEAALTASQAQTSITAPQTAVAGSTLDIDWTGPSYKDDYIGIGPVDATGGQRWKNYAFTRDGSPAQILVPIEPGDYRLTYFFAQDRTPAAQVAITVTPVETSLTAPQSAPAGSTIEVGWTGPDYASDYIGIGLRDSTGGQRWQAYAYTRDGTPARITLPDDPGSYVIRYFAAQDRTPLAQMPITLE